MRNTQSVRDEIGDSGPVLYPGAHNLTHDAALASSLDTRIKMVIAMPRFSSPSAPLNLRSPFQGFVDRDDYGER